MDGVFEWLNSTIGAGIGGVRDVLVARETTRQSQVDAQTSILAAQGLANSDARNYEAILRAVGLVVFGAGVVAVVLKSKG